MVVKGQYSVFRAAIGRQTKIFIQTDGVTVFKAGYGFATAGPDFVGETGMLTGDMVFIFTNDLEPQPTVEQMQNDGFTRMFGVQDIGYDVHQV